MKNLKIFLLFFNSVLVFSLITIGFFTQPYSELAPTILLLPVWAYFQSSLIHKITADSRFFAKRSVVGFMRILQIYSSLIVILIIIASLLNSSTFVEATFTILFMPFLAYFVIDLFDKKVIAQFKIKETITIEKLVRSDEKSDEILKKSTPEKEVIIRDDMERAEPEELMKTADGEGNLAEQDGNDVHISDQKRRQFLKIVGGGGISMFLMFFVFQQKASAAFFGSGGGPGIVSIKDSNDVKIDPSEKQPTDGYNVSEIDDDSQPSYYGFVHKNGNWYIAKEDNTGSYRYAKGSSNFSTNWANRAILTYDYFDNVF